MESKESGKSRESKKSRIKNKKCKYKIRKQKKL